MSELPWQGFECFVQGREALRARGGVRRRRNAGGQDAKPFVPGIARGALEADFAAGVAFPGVGFAGRVDDALLRDLAQPAERVAVAEISLREVFPGGAGHVLVDVGRLFALAHQFPQPPLDVRRQLRLICVQVVSQSGRIAGLNFCSKGIEIRHESLRRAASGLIVDARRAFAACLAHLVGVRLLARPRRAANIQTDRRSEVIAIPGLPARQRKRLANQLPTSTTMRMPAMLSVSPVGFSGRTDLIDRVRIAAERNRPTAEDMPKGPDIAQQHRFGTQQMVAPREANAVVKLTARASAISSRQSPRPTVRLIPLNCADVNTLQVERVDSASDGLAEHPFNLFSARLWPLERHFDQERSNRAAS